VCILGIGQRAVHVEYDGFNSHGFVRLAECFFDWIPACAGMTGKTKRFFLYAGMTGGAKGEMAR